MAQIQLGECSKIRSKDKPHVVEAAKHRHQFKLILNASLKLETNHLTCRQRNSVVIAVLANNLLWLVNVLMLGRKYSDDSSVSMTNLDLNSAAATQVQSQQQTACLDRSNRILMKRNSSYTKNEQEKNTVFAENKTMRRKNASSWTELITAKNKTTQTTPGSRT